MKKLNNFNFSKTSNNKMCDVRVQNKSNSFCLFLIKKKKFYYFILYFTLVTN